MSATYTWDVFMTLDGYGAYVEPGAGSISLNRDLLGAGLVDQLQVTVFPVVSGRSGADPLFKGADDFDLQLLDSRTLDGHITELTYRPTLHRS